MLNHLSGKMGKTANIIGATGLVGKQLVRQVIEHSDFSEVKIFVRKKTSINHPKLKEYIIDFEKPEEWANLVYGDVAFSTLGTTLKTAGSKEKQYMVDFTYQYRFAETASKNGIPSFVLVSSAGANAKSRVFYTRMKGELDKAVSILNFKKITILRPSILDGNRLEKRRTEKMSIHVMKLISRFIFRKYRPIKDEIVAQAMIKASLCQEEKLKIYELDQIFALAEM